MDDETSSRIKNLLLNIGQRQRLLPPDAEAVRRRMLASTFRIVGHTVSQNPHAAVSGNPGDMAGPDAAMHPDVAAQTDDALADDAGTDDTLDSEDAVQFDDAPQIDNGNSADDAVASHDLGLPDDAASANDMVPPVGRARPDVPAANDNRLLPDDVDWGNDPATLAAGGASQPAPGSVYPIARLGVDGPSHSSVAVNEPYRVRPGAAAHDPSQYVVPESKADSTSTDLEVTPAADFADSMQVTDSIADGAPLLTPVASDGQCGSLVARSAPNGSAVNPPSGASTPFGAQSANGGDCGGGCSRSTGAAVNSPVPDGASPSADDWESMDVTAVASEAIQAEVAQRIAAAVAERVAQAIDELRNDLYVSRAARNALFSR